MKTKKSWCCSATLVLALNDIHRARFFLMQQGTAIFYAMLYADFCSCCTSGKKDDGFVSEEG